MGAGGGLPAAPGWCRGRCLPFPGAAGAATEKRKRGPRARAHRPYPPQPHRPLSPARAAGHGQRALAGRAVTSPSRPRPDPNERERAARDAPLPPLPLQGRRRDQSEPPPSPGPSPPRGDVTEPPSVAERRSQSAPPRAGPVPCFRPAPSLALPPLQAPAVAAQPGSVRAGGGGSRGSATWSALWRGPSSTFSSPPTPTRWARTVGRAGERGSPLWVPDPPGARHPRGAEPGRPRRHGPPARLAEAGRSAGAPVRVPGLTRAVRGGAAEAWPGLPLSPPAAPSRSRRVPGAAQPGGGGGARKESESGRGGRRHPSASGRGGRPWRARGRRGPPGPEHRPAPPGCPPPALAGVREGAQVAAAGQSLLRPSRFAPLAPVAGCGCVPDGDAARSGNWLAQNTCFLALCLAGALATAVSYSLGKILVQRGESHCTALPSFLGNSGADSIGKVQAPCPRSDPVVSDPAAPDVLRSECARAEVLPLRSVALM